MYRLELLTHHSLGRDKQWELRFSNLLEIFKLQEALLGCWPFWLR